MRALLLAVGAAIVAGPGCGHDWTLHEVDGDAGGDFEATGDGDGEGDGDDADGEGDGGGGELDPCDPVVDGSCQPDLVCGPVAYTSDHACFRPVRLRGRVFDPGSDAGIAGARVVAVDLVGSWASDAATSASDGTFELGLPAEYGSDGAPAEGAFALRVVAQDRLPFPFRFRIADSIDVASAVSDESEWVVQGPVSDVALVELPGEARGLGSIAGTVEAEDPGGVMVVAEGGAGEVPLAWSDRSGGYRIFNVAAGTYEVRGYRAGTQFQDRGAVALADGQHATDVDLVEDTEAALAVVTGSVVLVNPGACDGTSVVLVPEATFDATSGHGEMAPGLRAPAPGFEPTITAAFSIGDVPDGEYVVLAAYENDDCILDPDTAIAGTQIVHITVDAATSGEVAIGGSFKVTGALAVIYPGATAPEVVSEPPSFQWTDDASEESYTLVVQDAFGRVVWSDDSVPGYSGGDPTVAYGGPTLTSGMYYRFRATSIGRTSPIATTEDLRGVFLFATP